MTLRAEAQRKRRAMQRKVLYTNPLVPVAGQDVDVFYNPDMTDLRGRPEVYMRGSWNRWTHPSAIPITRMDNAFSSGIGFLRVRCVLSRAAPSCMPGPAPRARLPSATCECFAECRPAARALCGW